MPRIERLHQNTSEWHRWRRQEIGASDAPVIMGATESMATGRRTYGCEVDVIKSSRKDGFDYSRVREDRGVNVEPYCKPPIAVVKINFHRAKTGDSVLGV